jgi:hypothetical protein
MTRRHGQKVYEGQTRYDAPEGEPVRDDLEVQVYEGDDEQDAGPRVVYHEGQGGPETVQQAHCQQGADELHHRVPHGNGLRTEPTFPPENEIADHRDVVVIPDWIPALRAARSGPDYGFVAGDPVDADIEEASYEEADKRCEDCHINRSDLPSGIGAPHHREPKTPLS